MNANSEKYCIYTDDEEHAFNHEECGDTRRRLYVRYVEGNWLCYCHNCGFNSRIGSGGFFLVRRNLNMEERCSKEIVNNSLTLDGCSYALSSEALNWLRKYQITDQEIQQYRFCMKGGKLVLPIYQDNLLLGWQERSLDGKGPKYITRTSHKRMLFQVLRGSPILVIVEDIISAIKVGRICSSMALLGSPYKIPEEVLKKLLTIPAERILVWFDRDKLKAALKWQARLNLLDKPARVITTPLDPKEYNTEEIQKWLK